MKNQYYHTPISVQEYIHAAEGFNGSDLIDRLKQFLTPKSSVLEIGSGPGTDWEILAKDYEVVGSDFSAEFLRHLRQKHPTGRFLELNAATLETEEAL